MVWVEEGVCWEVICGGGGCVKVLIFDLCVELGSDVACTGAFRMLLSMGSVGVDEDDTDSGGSPTGTKVCCSNCNGDSVWTPSDRKSVV